MAEGWETRRRIPRFRGIDLNYLGSRRGGLGRRIAVHEFRGRNQPFAEDLGGKARTFTVRGFVSGDTHDLDAEALEKAFRKAGPGELVLPHRAPISVACLDAEFEEPDRELRIQYWSAEFVEAGLPAIPGARVNTPAVVETFVGRVLAAVEERFAAVFTISDQTQAAIDRTVAVASQAVAIVETAFDNLKAAAEAVEEIADYAQTISNLANTISGTIVDAAVAAREFQNALTEILELPLAPLEVFRELKHVAQFGLELQDPGEQTAARTSFKRNQTALVAMVQQSATAVRAKALSRATFESSTEASEYRDEIAAELATVIYAASDALDDETAAELRSLRTSTLRDIDARASRLPSRVQFTTDGSSPAILISYRLYGEATRDAEIVARNRPLIRNPGRVAYGTPLEVLGNV